mmetsp:Transcript_42157/g.111454  ORF Transcript_42157/g.111454 Transcript_42157/m.111454 type:complete len:322 (+) Transcript_42157:810-1775(+)
MQRRELAMLSKEHQPVPSAPSRLNLQQVNLRLDQCLLQLQIIQLLHLSNLQRFHNVVDHHSQKTDAFASMARRFCEARDGEEAARGVDCRHVLVCQVPGCQLQLFQDPTCTARHWLVHMAAPTLQSLKLLNRGAESLVQSQGLVNTQDPQAIDTTLQGLQHAHILGVYGRIGVLVAILETVPALAANHGCVTLGPPLQHVVNDAFLGALGGILRRGTLSATHLLHLSDHLPHTALAFQEVLSCQGCADLLHGLRLPHGAHLVNASDGHLVCSPSLAVDQQEVCRFRLVHKQRCSHERGVQDADALPHFQTHPLAQEMGKRL